MKAARIVLIFVSAALLLSVSFIFVRWGGGLRVLKVADFTHEEGYAYFLRPELPAHLFKFGNIHFKIKYKIKTGDTSKSPSRSSLLLYENGKALGPAHSLHDAIRNQGEGRYSHWGESIYFSASDNSIPSQNGRDYSVQAEIQIAGAVKKLLTLSLVAAILGLSIGFYGFWLWLGLLLRELRPLSLIALFSILLGWLLKWNHLPIGMHPMSVVAHGLLLFMIVFLCVALAFSLKRNPVPSQVRGAVIFCGCLLAFGQMLMATEIVCRIFPLPDTLAVNPGIRHFWPDWIHYPLNHDGFREKEFSETKSPETFRIFLVGDSDIEGAGLPRSKTAGRFLEAELNQRLASAGIRDKRVEVFNMGHCGANTVQEFEWMKRETPRLRPDLVVMAYVLNDAEEESLSLINSGTSRLRAKLNEMLTGTDGSYFWYRYLDFERMWLRRNISDRRYYGNYYEAIHCDQCAGWIKAQNTFGELDQLFKSNRTDWFYAIYPFFFKGTVLPSMLSLHAKVGNAMLAKGVNVYDSLPYFLSFERDLGQFAFSFRDPHPNARAQRLFSIFLAEHIAGRPAFQKYFGTDLKATK